MTPVASGPLTSVISMSLSVKRRHRLIGLKTLGLRPLPHLGNVLQVNSHKRFFRHVPGFSYLFNSFSWQDA